MGASWHLTRVVSDSSVSHSFIALRFTSGGPDLWVMCFDLWGLALEVDL